MPATIILMLNFLKNQEEERNKKKIEKENIQHLEERKQEHTQEPIWINGKCY